MLFTIFVFLILLGILVFVHELGHFVTARRLGVKADEFGFGFPPRIFGVQFVKKSQIASKTVETIETAISQDKSNKTDIISAAVVDATITVSQIEREKKWRVIWGNRDTKELTAEGNSDWGTIYSLNWIPLGGFVKIKGEDGEHKNETDSFASQKIWKRGAILSAGVAMNVVLCAAALMLAFMIGAPQIVDSVKSAGVKIRDEKIQVISILKNSPAANAGIQLGDAIQEIDGKKMNKVEEVQSYVQSKDKQEIAVGVERLGQKLIYKIQPVVLKETQKPGLGVGLARTGIVSYPWYKAIWFGIRDTYYLGEQIIVAFAKIIKNAVIGEPLGVDVAGPVGIAVMTGQVARMGFIYILQFVALLSLNLAIINFLPFPALDGGRVLFLIIEKIRGRAVNQKIEQITHSVGFALLMVLVLIVTSRDIMKFKDFFINLWQKIN
ncbi:RIP metalloprotease RseP [Candidatus Falkowbacteria bacterium]|nr:RIP metalloprotease RseP [Candidatus Falkowbacteria bacterium]